MFFIFFLFGLLIFLVGCAQAKNIRGYELITISDSYGPLSGVDSVKPSIWENAKPEVYFKDNTALRIFSKDDFSKIILNGEYDHLYYVISDCKSGLIEFEPKISAVFLNESDKMRENEYIYYIFVDEVTSNKIANFQDKELCLHLQAGSMVGFSLKTNKLELEF